MSNAAATAASRKLHKAIGSCRNKDVADAVYFPKVWCALPCGDIGQRNSSVYENQFPLQNSGRNSRDSTRASLNSDVLRHAKAIGLAFARQKVRGNLLCPD
jgi:hypothetical protein